MNEPRRTHWSFRRIDWEEYYAANFRLLETLLQESRPAVQRTMERARAEYDAKWAERRNALLDPAAFKHDLLYPSPGTEVAFSMRDELFLGDLVLRHGLKDSLINNVVARTGSGPVCILGCGFGESTTRLITSRLKYGGELTESGVACCRDLGLDVTRFNYYETPDYGLIRPGSTILSVHSLEQIPDSRPFLDGMRSVRDRVEFVIHLEPTWLAERKGVVGYLRNRYIEVNDYNRNLYTVLLEAEDVEIVAFEPDVFGQAPLNSASLIVWRFKS